MLLNSVNTLNSFPEITGVIDGQIDTVTCVIDRSVDNKKKITCK